MAEIIPVEVSARHVHLSEKDFEKLFGEDKTLTIMKELSQPGEFASNKTLTLANSDEKIENVRILGPFRENSQAEISMTDAYSLKLKPFPKIRVSGNLADTEKITIKTKSSSLKIPCIIAQRHLHCSLEEAEKLKLKNNQKISVKIKGKQREITFHDIVVRASENYRLSLHLDTDEGNAAGIFGEAFGKIVK
jgi:propanediol utilization protein